MGKWIHKLTDKNLEKRTAHCEGCAETVSLILNGKTFYCENAQRDRWKRKASRQLQRGRESGSWVYVVYDHGDVLYVGSTGNPYHRLSVHRSESSWWNEVASIQWTHCENRASALDLEIQLIQQLQPQFNTHHK